MEPLQFLCPACHIPLKLRPTREPRTRFPCPDCTVQLVLIRSGLEDWRIEYDPSPVAVKPLPPPELAAPAEATPLAERWHELSPLGPRGPQRWAWAFGICAMTGLVGLFIWQSFRKPVVAPVAPIAAVEHPPAETNAPAPPPAETAETRLVALGEMLRKSLAIQGHFPRGSAVAEHIPVERRLSWLAELLSATEGPTAPQPLFDRSWNDPAQETFVRRALPQVQNPDLDAPVGEDGYPATHFAGIAGVGGDAAQLPVTHPRAGIFGDARTTRIEDITDGLSHTWMLAGVNSHLGTWAAAGRSSYRPVTSEPYINGPDGFGTGTPDSMFVLMADGSVRTVSAKTHPRIVRRWAAMADGLPLDEKIPGEPGDAPTAPPMPTIVIVPPPAPKTPGTVVAVAPIPELTEVPAPLELPPLDIAAALQRQVLKFEQTRPAPVFKLLLQVEELSGVRIDYDRQGLGEAGQRLDQAITLTLDKPNLQQLLDEILTRAKLAYRVEPRRIIITAP